MASANAQSGSAQQMTAGKAELLKRVSLIVLTLQNVSLILVMRYVRIRPGERFYSTTAVVMSELTKLVICLTVIFKQEGYNVQKFLQFIINNTRHDMLDCLKVSVPSLVYVLQNILLYTAVSNLDAATFQVSYQLKLLTTAFFSVFILHRKIAWKQWLALLVLFAGIAVVQLQPASSSASTAAEQNPMLGLMAVLVACLMSGFAGVYFESILKGSDKSLWWRNVQLAFLGVIWALCAVFTYDREKVQTHGFFYGYDWVVWLVILLQSAGGLVVAVVVKYADNILKGFSTSVAIVVSCVVSVYFFNFQISWEFGLGATLVLLATLGYTKAGVAASVAVPSSADAGPAEGTLKSAVSSN